MHSGPRQTSMIKLFVKLVNILLAVNYFCRKCHFNPLSANPTKWSNTLRQFASKLPTRCLSVFDHFVKLALKGLSIWQGPECAFEKEHAKAVFVSNLIIKYQ